MLPRPCRRELLCNALVCFVSMVEKTLQATAQKNYLNCRKLLSENNGASHWYLLAMLLNQPTCMFLLRKKQK